MIFLNAVTLSAEGWEQVAAVEDNEEGNVTVKGTQTQIDTADYAMLRRDDVLRMFSRQCGTKCDVMITYEPG